MYDLAMKELEKRATQLFKLNQPAHVLTLMSGIFVGMAQMAQVIPHNQGRYKVVVAAQLLDDMATEQRERQSKRGER